MKRTPLLVAVLILAAETAGAQTLTPGRAARTLFSAADSALAASAGSRRSGDGPWHLGTDLALTPATGSLDRSLTLAAEARFWRLAIEPRRLREADIDWWGLFTQQTRVDATMHWIRLRQSKFHEPLYHSRYFRGYAEALKGYYSLPLRWDDGDDFLTNDVGHPIMGAVFSYTFTDYDRRCTNLVFGEGPYWSCMKRAAIYASLASANWEWNPVMSESALGHIGKFRTCEHGRCTGEGGWTDLVVTPLGGMGIRIAGDLARARLWPLLDRRLSGNAAARAINYAVKSLTAPGHLLNCAFKLDFDRAWTAAPVSARRAN